MPLATGRRILVTDGQERAALAITRSLGSSGHAIFVASQSPRPLAGASRFCRRSFRTPRPLETPGSFVDRIEDIVRRTGIEILIPVTEPSLLALLPAQDRLVGVRVPFSPADAFERASDKQLVADEAEAVGIRVPAQVVLAGPEALEELAAPSFPVVLKPHRSVVGQEARRVKTSVHYAKDMTQARAVLGSLPASAFPILAQERILGPGTGIFLLLWDGEIRAVFAHRRLREKPPSGGVSVYRESVAAPAELVKRSADLLRALGCQGVAMIEFKVQEATGEPYLMEINCRFWGSLQLAVDAGVDFPALLVQCAEGHPLTGRPEYRQGIRSRWLWGDIDHLWARLRPGGGENLPPGSPGRLATFASVALPWRPGDRTEVLRVSDPGPFLRETAQWFAEVR